MSISRAVLPFLGFSIFALGQGPSTGRQLTSREIFYEPLPQAPAPVKKPAARAKRPEAAVAPKSIETARGETPRVSPDGTRLTVAASEVRNPLGIRYTVLKRVSDGEFVAVAPDSGFHSGDRIKLQVEVNDSGYLYVIHRGSTGTWKPLYPDEKAVKNENRYDRHRPYDSKVFSFDRNAGAEKLFIVFAREETDLEQLMIGLSSEGKHSGEPARSPSPPAQRTGTLMAENRPPISDEMVGRLRNAYGRDLIVEQPSDETKKDSAPDTKRDYGVYLVNPHGQPDSRVVADITFTHR